MIGKALSVTSAQDIAGRSAPGAFAALALCALGWTSLPAAGPAGAPAPNNEPVWLPSRIIEGFVQPVVPQGLQQHGQGCVQPMLLQGWLHRLQNFCSLPHRLQNFCSLPQVA